jgi:hypothetical protein
MLLWEYQQLEDEVRQLDEVPCSRGGSLPGKRGNIKQNREEAHNRLWRNYFAENPLYSEADFRHRFRMCKDLFIRIHDELIQHDSYFVQKPDAFNSECSMPAIGLDADQDLQEALTAICTRAESDGASDWYLSQLLGLLHKFRDVFRIRLGPDGLAKVRPLELQIKSGANPVRCKNRHHPQAHQDFMREHVRQLALYDLVYPNQSSEWASAAFAVPKPGDRGLRLVIDLRAGFVGPMPYLDAVSSYLADSTCFFELDAFKGYWQFPVTGAIESQSFMTPDGIFPPTRLAISMIVLVIL